ncbi:MAG: alpha/beta hydrolase [Acidimicrobiia bacterium]
MVEPVTLITSDGHTLVGERNVLPGAHAQVVLCHPHPQHGGSMQSLVTSELFRALPERGIACLRFNFRGVGASTGAFDHGLGERLDVLAALGAAVEAAPGLPTFLVGWSFGADLALSIRDERHAGWVGIAVPLHWLDDPAATGADPRPKLLLLADHDEFQPAATVAVEVAGWVNTHVEVVGGASHFFVGRTGVLAEHVTAWVERLISR